MVDKFNYRLRSLDTLRVTPRPSVKVSEVKKQPNLHGSAGNEEPFVDRRINWRGFEVLASMDGREL
jgi:hypothetical protein